MYSRILIAISCLYICLFVYLVIKSNTDQFNSIAHHGTDHWTKKWIPRNLLFANVSQLLKKLSSKYWAKMVNEYQKTGGENY